MRGPDTILVTGQTSRWITYPPLRQHLDGCTRPGMLWQESIRGLPKLGQCPDCGALSRRLGAKKTVGKKVGQLRRKFDRRRSA